MTPGCYIRFRREADRLTLDDVALALDSTPPVSHRARIELLAAIEADVVPVSLSTAWALFALLSIDLEVLSELVETQPAERPADWVHPRLRRAGRGPLWANIGGEAAA